MLSPAENSRVSNLVHPTPSLPFNNKYIHIKAIGSGGEATCDRYEEAGVGTAVAVKTVVRPNPHTNYLHEADVLATLPKHPRTIELLEVFQGQEEPLRIVMPLYTGGDITQTVKKFSLFGTKIPESFIWHSFLQLIDGIHHLHTNPVLPVLHRDLKPENLLIEAPGEGKLFDNIKIIDFGMATTNTDPHEHRGGTPKYQPPESPIASKAADVYAAGACVYFMLTGKAPKPECPGHIQSHARHAFYSNSPQLVQRIVHSDHTDFYPDNQPLSYDEAVKATFNHATPLPRKGYSPLLEYWLMRALDPNAETRATTTELLANMAADANKQIDFYLKWVPVSNERPLCRFAYPEPPAGWRPE